MKSSTVNLPASLFAATSGINMPPKMDKVLKPESFRRVIDKGAPGAGLLAMIFTDKSNLLLVVRYAAAKDLMQITRLLSGYFRVQRA